MKTPNAVTTCTAVFLLIVSCACNPKKAAHNLLYGSESATDTSLVDCIDSNMSALIFDSKTYDTQTGFESIVLSKVFVKLFPNRGGRRAIEKDGESVCLKNVLGVTQFLMDHDLTSGFRDTSVVKFFRGLRQNDFVLKFHRDSTQNDEGWIEYLHKWQAPDEREVGNSTGFFRQWRLSEIDYTRNKEGKVLINVQPSAYATDLFCPQAKKGTQNPFAQSTTEIPVWITSVEGGMKPLDDYDKLGLFNGGTVVIIWHDTLAGKIFFKDIHGSLKRIINTAIEIADKYHVDPTIGIYDAGRMARKLKAKNGVLCFKDLDIISEGYPDFVSAGYCYIDQKQYIKTQRRGGRLLKWEDRIEKKVLFSRF